ncbi:MAG: ATP phosphoribosyltransferase regulatory subunit [Desulfitobacteriaceae bacterium]
MQRTLLGLRIPAGMHDLLPDQLVLQERLEQKLGELFRQWSYQKVLTPTMEFAACVQPDIDREDQLYKFFDKQGHVLALRPEFTTPIARLVSTRLRASEVPLRLCYGADVFRNAPTQYREFRQAGVELVGSGEDAADAEVIALAIKGMQELGIQDFQFNLGHMGIFTGLMSDLDVPVDFQVQLEEGLARKDMVRVEALVSQSGLKGEVQDLLLRLPHLHGGEEILDEVLSWNSSQAIKDAVGGLRRVYHYLRDFGVQRFVALDLGILRGFSYYTGVIFEGYVHGVGFPVVEGGRYDALYTDFDYPQPATGFAIHLGSLLGQFPHMESEGADILVFGKEPSQVIKRCQELRDTGKKVEMALGMLNQEEAESFARKRNIPQIEET